MSADSDSSEFRLSRSKLVISAAKELDAYISIEEKRFGEIITRNYGWLKVSGRQPKIVRSLIGLKAALKKDKSDREEAYEYLRKSNRAMKKVIENLQEEMNFGVRNELLNVETLNTERLLSINPKFFTV